MNISFVYFYLEPPKYLNSDAGRTYKVITLKPLMTISCLAKMLHNVSLLGLIKKKKTLISSEFMNRLINQSIDLLLLQYHFIFKCYLQGVV